MGLLSANLTYSNTSQSPNRYSIVYDAAAKVALFADVTDAALTASPIVLTVPPTAAPGTYNANLMVRNATGCESNNYPITVTVRALPTITLDANPEVCLGLNKGEYDIFSHNGISKSV